MPNQTESTSAVTSPSKSGTVTAIVANGEIGLYTTDAVMTFDQWRRFAWRIKRMMDRQEDAE